MQSSSRVIVQRPGKLRSKRERLSNGRSLVASGDDDCSGSMSPEDASMIGSLASRSDSLSSNASGPSQSSISSVSASTVSIHVVDFSLTGGRPGCSEAVACFPNESK